MNLTFKIAIVVFLELALSSSVVLAKKKAKAQAKEPLPVEAVQELLLDRDRQGAIDSLNNFILRDPSEKDRKEAVRLLDTISAQFFSLKTQQEFEYGISAWPTDASLAQLKFREALKSEPDNLDLQSMLIRILLQKKETSSAREMLSRIRKANPRWSSLPLLSAQLFIAENNFKEALLEVSKQEQSGPLDCYWLVLKAEVLFKSGNFAEALATALSARTLSPDFPESHFWIAKTLREEMNDSPQRRSQSEAAALDYLKLCKALKPRDFRKHLLDPMLCHRTSEVERFERQPNSI